MAFSATDGDGGDISNIFDALVDGSHLILRNVTDETQYRIYTIDSVTDNSTWYQIQVNYVDGNGATSMVDTDEYEIDFYRDGKLEPGTNSTDAIRDIPTWSFDTKEWLPSGSNFRLSLGGSNTGGRVQIGSPGTVTVTDPQLLFNVGAFATRYNYFIQGSGTTEGAYLVSDFAAAPDNVKWGMRTGSVNTDLFEMTIDNEIKVQAAAGWYMGERASADGNLTGYGQIWAGTDNSLNFTDEAGANTILTASAGGSPFDTPLEILGDTDVEDHIALLTFKDNQDVNEQARFGFDTASAASGVLRSHNMFHHTAAEMHHEFVFQDSGGTIRPSYEMFGSDHIFYEGVAGVEVLRFQNDGIRINSDVAGDRGIFWDESSISRAKIVFDEPIATMTIAADDSGVDNVIEFQVRHSATYQPFTIYGDSSGLGYNMLWVYSQAASADTDAMRCVIGTAGHIEINNLVTSDAFERALTVNDLAFSAYWTFSTFITDSNMHFATGQLRFNSATLASVTEMYIHDLPVEGPDMDDTMLAGSIQVGDVITIRQNDDDTFWWRGTVDAITDNVPADGAHQIDVTHISSNGTLPVSSDHLMVQFYPQVAGGSGNVSNTGTPLDNQVAVWTDATTIEGNATLTFDGATLIAKSTANSASQITIGERVTLRGDAQDAVFKMYGEDTGVIYGIQMDVLDSNMRFIGADDAADVTHVVFSGLTLRIGDGGGTDWMGMSHDGTDLNVQFTNTVDYNLLGLTGDMIINRPIHISNLSERFLLTAGAATPTVGAIGIGASADANKVIQVEGTTAGDQAGFVAFTSAGNDHRAFFGVHDADTWGLSATGTVNPTEFVIESGGEPIIAATYNGSTRIYANNNLVATFLESATNEQLLLPLQNIPALPSLGFGDGDTGFHESSDDTLQIAIGGADLFKFEPTGSGRFMGVATSAFGLLNEAASATNPNIVPNESDEDTGIGSTTADTGLGWTSADRGTLIAGGITIAEFFENAGDPQLILPLNNGSEAAPALAFGDGQDGIFSGVDGELSFTLDGTTRWKMVPNFDSALVNGPVIIRTATSDTIPNLTPRRLDTDTGIGSAAADQLSLIAGGVEGARIEATQFTMINYVFDSDQTVGVGQDNFVLTYNDSSGQISLEASAGGGDVTATPTPVDNQLAIWDGATSIEGDSNLTYDGTTFTLGGGKNWVIRDSGGSDFAQYFHDGVDFNTVFFQTTDWNIRDGVVVKIFDGTDVDFMSMHHDGTDFDFAFGGTGIVTFGTVGSFYNFVSNVDITADLFITGGNQLQIFDTSGADSVIFEHDGTDFITTFDGTTDWDIIGIAGGDINLRDGVNLWIWDSADSSAFSIRHDGTDINILGTLTTDINITGVTNVNLSGNPLLTSVAVSDLDNGTDGELITWSASAVATTVPVGTSGHVLTSGGTGVAPTFQAAAGGGGGETAIKTALQAIDTQTTLQDDDHIAFTGLDADTWYTVEGYFEIRSTATPDLKSQFVFTQTPGDTGTIHYVGNHTTTRNVYNVQTEAAFNGLSTWVWGTNQTFSFFMNGVFKTNASTGGDLQFKWAQVVSSGSAVTIYAGSWVRIAPV
jgi:hypothetical protein